MKVPGERERSPAGRDGTRRGRDPRDDDRGRGGGRRGEERRREESAAAGTWKRTQPREPKPGRGPREPSEAPVR